MNKEPPQDTPFINNFEVYGQYPNKSRVNNHQQQSKKLQKPKKSEVKNKQDQQPIDFVF